MAKLGARINSKRRIWLALILSLIVPGLGQAYCGRLRRGLVLFCLCYLPCLAIICLFHVSSAVVVTPIAMFLIGAAIVVEFIAIIDAGVLARRAGPDYQFKNYNNPIVYILLIFLALPAGIIIAYYVEECGIEAFEVSTLVCYPTILPNDRIFVNKSAYRTQDPQRGDLVVFSSPHNHEYNDIRRVVAVAGDTVVKIEHENVPYEGGLFEELNGDSKYKIFLARSPVRMGTEFRYLAEITISEGHCFVLDDNRNLPYDSRNYGPIHLDTIKGRADYIYFPSGDWSRFGRIEH